MCGVDLYFLSEKLFITKVKNPMAKSNLPSVLEIKSELKSKILKPIYFLCGVDSYGIDYAISEIKKFVEPLISSDFDKETYYASNKDLNLSDIFSAARTFPFGSGKKLIIVKNAEQIKTFLKDQSFIEYLKNPAEFTILICSYEGKINTLSSEPFKTLIKSEFIYESAELKGASLVKWVVQYVAEKNKKLSAENASLLIDIVGENRDLLENQIEKLVEYIGEHNEITFEAIEGLATKLKIFTNFDLFNAIDKKDKAKSLEIAYNLLDKSDLGLIGIVAMLNKHFTALLRIEELEKSQLSEFEKAKITGTGSFYYKDYLYAARSFSYKGIAKALDAIYNADVQIKSTSLDEKTILTMLIAEILSE